jgi:hypothetical protein
MESARCWMQLPWFYRTFLHALHTRQIRYLLVGGYAVRFYGYMRMTKDLDIWTPTDQADAAKICQLCRDVFELPDLPVEPFANECRIIHLTRAPSHAEIRLPIIGARPEVLTELAGANTQVEILTVQSGVDFESCYRARVMADVDGVPVSIVSLPHLKIIKGVTFGRERDRDDIAHLS